MALMYRRLSFSNHAKTSCYCTSQTALAEARYFALWAELVYARDVIRLSRGFDQTLVSQTPHCRNRVETPAVQEIDIRPSLLVLVFALADHNRLLTACLQSLKSNRRAMHARRNQPARFVLPLPQRANTPLPAVDCFQITLCSPMETCESAFPWSPVPRPYCEPGK